MSVSSWLLEMILLISWIECFCLIVSGDIDCGKMMVFLSGSIGSVVGYLRVWLMSFGVLNVMLFMVSLNWGCCCFVIVCLIFGVM